MWAWLIKVFQWRECEKNSHFIIESCNGFPGHPKCIIILLMETCCLNDFLIEKNPDFGRLGLFFRLQSDVELQRCQISSRSTSTKDPISAAALEKFNPCIFCRCIFADYDKKITVGSRTVDVHRSWKSSRRGQGLKWLKWPNFGSKGSRGHQRFSSHSI